jgi:hypothetical protein
MLLYARLQAAFQQIETVVPRPPEGQKPSKASTLQAAIEHIQNLEQETSSLADEATRLKAVRSTVNTQAFGARIAESELHLAIVL